jgi:phage gpG-like protein
MNDSSQLIFDRLSARIQSAAPSDDVLKAGLTRIAMIIIGKAKLNVRRQKMVDTGRLMNSLRWEFYRNNDEAGIKVGSFGTIYAAMNEFGGPISERQRRAIFAAMSRKRVKRASKNVLQKGGRYWRPRPFLTPAIKDSAKEILDVLRQMIGGKK